MFNMLGTCFIYCFNPKHRLKGFYSSRSKAGGYKLHTYDSCYASLMCNGAFRQVGRQDHCKSSIYKVGGNAQQQHTNIQGKLKQAIAIYPASRPGNAVAGKRMRQRKETARGGLVRWKRNKTWFCNWHSDQLFQVTCFWTKLIFRS